MADEYNTKEPPDNYKMDIVDLPSSSYPLSPGACKPTIHPRSPSSPPMSFTTDNEEYNRNEAHLFDDKMLADTPRGTFAIDPSHEVRIHMETNGNQISGDTSIEGTPVPSESCLKSDHGTPRSSKKFTNSQDSESYGYFKTRSSSLIPRSSSLIPALEKQLSRLKDRDPGGKLDAKPYVPETCPDVPSNLPTGRYFDALQGAELEELKGSEDILLPKDQQWPFLLRFPISSYGICLGLGSQAILWKQLTLNSATKFLHVPSSIHVVLWSLAVVAFLLIFFTYMLKCIFYLEAVRREYRHPVRVNFFFAPWISGMFLALGVPSMVADSAHSATWCILMVPIFVLELKIYGDWLSGGDRRLSKVANPSSHLSVVGNFVGALLFATVGWKEVAIFFCAVGLAHYVVLFVTLYQRLPTNEVLPRELHPVFFLFLAAPSAASLAWESITGDYGYPCRLAYFNALFLYCSLVVRVNFFRGYKFSIAWWAYTFPMTELSLATLRYAHKVMHPVTQTMAMLLSLLSAIIVFLFFISTLMHFFWGTLFPNDMAIAITQKPCKEHDSENHSIRLDGGSQNNVKLFGCLKSVPLSDSDEMAAKIIDKSI